MKLIGISAPKGGGKTTFAQMIKKNLEDNYQKNVVIYPLAGPLKEVCGILFGGEKNHWYGSDADKNTKLAYWEKALGEPYSTPRRIMQSIGTEVIRNHVHDQFWLLAFNAKLKQNQHINVVIVDDIRFTNEAQYIREVGGKVTHITRQGKGWSKEHASECGPNVDYDADLSSNFTDLEDMKVGAAQVVRNILTMKDITCW